MWSPASLALIATSVSALAITQPSQPEKATSLLVRRSPYEGYFSRSKHHRSESSDVSHGYFGGPGWLDPPRPERPTSTWPPGWDEWPTSTWPSQWPTSTWPPPGWPNFPTPERPNSPKPTWPGSSGWDYQSRTAYDARWRRWGYNPWDNPGHNPPIPSPTHRSDRPKYYPRTPFIPSFPDYPPPTHPDPRYPPDVPVVTVTVYAPSPTPTIPEPPPEHSGWLGSQKSIHGEESIVREGPNYKHYGRRRNYEDHRSSRSGGHYVEHHRSVNQQEQHTALRGDQPPF